MPLPEQALSAGEPWYSSGTFWTIVAVVVAVMAIVVGVWASFRSARPQRALYITMNQAVPLLRAVSGLDGRELAVSLEGQKLTAPYLVTVDVVSDSPLDIAPAAFSGTPLELEFGVPILALLDKTSDAGRAGIREPAVKVHKTALLVGPALLTRQHRLRYTVLLDGKPQFQPMADLVDVPLRQLPSLLNRPTAKSSIIQTIALPVYMVSAVGIGSWLLPASRTIILATGLLALLSIATLSLFRSSKAESRLRNLQQYMDPGHSNSGDTPA